MFPTTENHTPRECLYIDCPIRKYIILFLKFLNTINKVHFFSTPPPPKKNPTCNSSNNYPKGRKDNSEINMFGHSKTDLNFLTFLYLNYQCVLVRMHE